MTTRTQLQGSTRDKPAEKSPACLAELTPPVGARVRLCCLDVGRGTHVASEVEHILVIVKVLAYGCHGGFTMVQERRIKPSLRIASRLALGGCGPSRAAHRRRCGLRIFGRPLCLLSGSGGTDWERADVAKLDSLAAGMQAPSDQRGLLSESSSALPGRWP